MREHHPERANGYRGRERIPSNGDRPGAASVDLWLHCPAACERLLQFSRDWRASGGGWKVDKFGLQNAAEEVLRAIQRELQRLESPLDPLVALTLWRQRRWALLALRELPRSNEKFAKGRLLAVTDHAPLTICVGGNCTIATADGPLTTWVPGCFAVFNDVTRTSGGRMWPNSCPDCRPRNGRRNPPRDWKREMHRRFPERIPKQR